MAASIPNLSERALESVFHPQTHLAQVHDTGLMMIDRAEGIYCYDNKGKQYIEGVAALWCTALG